MLFFYFISVSRQFRIHFHKHPQPAKSKNVLHLSLAEGLLARDPGLTPTTKFFPTTAASQNFYTSGFIKHVNSFNLSQTNRNEKVFCASTAKPANSGICIIPQ